MEFTPTVSEWLPWLGRVRFLIITFLVMVVVAVRQLTPVQIPVHTLVPLVMLWYTLAVLYLILHRWLPQARWQAPLQMTLDLVIITGVVYATGAQDSDFISLYLLAILMGSIFFSGRGAFLGGRREFRASRLGRRAFLLRNHSSHRQLDAGSSRAGILAGHQSFRFLGRGLPRELPGAHHPQERRGTRREERGAQGSSRPSIRTSSSPCAAACSPPISTAASCCSIAPARKSPDRFSAFCGDKKFRIVSRAFGPWKWTNDGNPRALRKEIEFHTPDGQLRFLGISISLLRTGDQASGFVFNFQDLTELKRLEREVVTKERMAALGRLAAAIAHEIRQPLTAMTGALKELARLAPLEDDDKKLVQIVSRESQRLNQIITDFLDYSREKNYKFADVDIAALVEETLLLHRAQPQRHRQIPDRAEFARAQRLALASTATR